jgi:ribonuclease R
MTTKDEFIARLKAQTRPKTHEEWVEELHLKSDSDLRSFLAMVKRLTDAGEITLTKKNRIILAEDAGWVIGPLSVHAKGYGFVDTADQHIYIPAESIGLAMHGDEVAVSVNQHPDGLSSGRIERIVTRKTTRLTVVVRDRRLWPTDRRIQTRLVLEKPMALGEGQLWLADIMTYGDPLVVRLTESLGHESDPGADILTILHNHQIPMVFDTAVHDEVKRFPDAPIASDLQGRIDYRDQPVVTIDGEDAKDFDDAIHLGNENGQTVLYVHIADVAHYVQPNSAIDAEAQKRTTSVYVVDRVVPMLPFELSNGLCSLMEGQDRLTLTCKMRINEHGEVTDYAIHPSVIRSHKRLTYTRVNRLIHGESVDLDPALQIELQKMHALAQRIRQRREADGAINFDTTESKFTVSAQGKVLNIAPRISDEAEKLIEDFMVCANETVAKHCRYLDIPILYRVHDAPSKTRLTEFENAMAVFGVKIKGAIKSPSVIQNVLAKFEGHDEYPVINELLLRSMAKAIYDPRPLGHYGLALENYCHFTSPIRRYPDLIVHRMLHRYAFSTPEASRSADEVWVDAMARQCSLGEQRAVEAERATESMKEAEYMEQHIGDVFEGIISGVTKFGFFVRLPNTVEGLVHIRNLDGYFVFDPSRLALRSGAKQYRLSQKVTVKVMAADKANATIDFHVVESKR